MIHSVKTRISFWITWVLHPPDQRGEGPFGSASVHYSIKRSFKAGLKIDAFPADEVKMGLSLYRDGGPKKVVIKILKENWLEKSPKFDKTINFCTF